MNGCIGWIGQKKVKLCSKAAVNGLFLAVPAISGRAFSREESLLPPVRDTRYFCLMIGKFLPPVLGFTVHTHLLIFVFILANNMLSMQTLTKSLVCNIMYNMSKEEYSRARVHWHSTQNEAGPNPLAEEGTFRDISLEEYDLVVVDSIDARCQEREISRSEFMAFAVQFAIRNNRPFEAAFEPDPDYDPVSKTMEAMKDMGVGGSFSLDELVPTKD